MYAAKAASGGGPAGQVQGQQGVPSSGQGVYGFFKTSLRLFVGCSLYTCSCMVHTNKCLGRATSICLLSSDCVGC